VAPSSSIHVFMDGALAISLVRSPVAFLLELMKNSHFFFLFGQIHDQICQQSHFRDSEGLSFFYLKFS